ncbi:MAG: hypothetical protein GMKNLPBB_01190 [Myxococcota bacterium]|nr:hypothetical protein [Myxococcota bacterium]
MANAYRFVIRAPTGHLMEHTMQEEVITIGRDPGNDLILNAPSVSRNHARIYIWEGQCCIQDLGSSNGVYVNGHKITEAVSIDPSCSIDVGGFEIAFAGSEAARFDEKPRVQSPSLKAVSGKFAGQSFPFPPDRSFTLGRIEQGNGIVVADNSISRQHVRISIQGAQWIIQDLGSSNGTHVNGNKITTSPLDPGDKVRIGVIDFEFTVPGVAPAAGPAGRPATGGLAAAPPPPPKPALDKNELRNLWILAGVFLVVLLSILLFVVIRLKNQDAEQQQVEQEETVVNQKVLSALSEAKKLMGERDWSKASLRVDEALEVDPDNGEAQKLREEIGKEKRFQEFYENGVRAFDAKSWKVAVKEFERVDESSRYYTEVLKRLPAARIRDSIPNEKLAEAMLNYYEGRFVKAEEIVKAEARGNSRDAVDILRMLGEVSGLSKDIKNRIAQGDLENALAGLKNLDRVERQMMRMDAASEFRNLAAEKVADYLAEQAEKDYGRQLYEEAFKRFKQAHEIYNNHAKTKTFLGRLEKKAEELISQGRHGEAMKITLESSPVYKKAREEMLEK